MVIDGGWTYLEMLWAGVAAYGGGKWVTQSVQAIQWRELNGQGSIRRQSAHW